MYREYKGSTMDQCHKSSNNESTETISEETDNMDFANPEWSRVSITTTEMRQANNPTRDASVELTVEDFTERKWEREQEKLKKLMLLDDVEDWSRYRLTPDMLDQHPFKQPLQYIGGVDISFVKGDNINACAAFVVLNYPELEVVYEDLSMVQLTAPYIPGFLAFREADFLVDKVSKLRRNHPELLPQVILVDGNGTIHQRGFGLACHLGVLTDVATVGAAKNMLYIDGLEREEVQKQAENLQKAGDTSPLIGQSGKQHGVVYRSCDSTTNPIYISPGHKVSMDTAVWITEKCIKYRVPEPTRQADILSREYLRTHWNIEVTSGKKKQKKTKKPKNTQQKNEEPSPQKETQYEKWQDGDDLGMDMFHDSDDSNSF